MNSEDILRVLDNPKSLFPALPPTDFAYVRARLTAFRIGSNWLVVVEVFGYDSEVGLVVDDVTAIGSHVQQPNRCFLVNVVTPVPGKPDYPDFEEDPAGKILLDPLNFALEINGVVQRFSLKPQDYERFGVDLHTTMGGELDALVKVLRWLAFEMPERLFMSQSTLAERFDLPENLSPFVQTYDWHHPDFRLGELPSNSRCFRTLANALANDDVSLYECPPTDSNTHWSKWPEWPN